MPYMWESPASAIKFTLSRCSCVHTPGPATMKADSHSLIRTVENINTDFMFKLTELQRFASNLSYNRKTCCLVGLLFFFWFCDTETSLFEDKWISLYFLFLCMWINLKSSYCASASYFRYSASIIGCKNQNYKGWSQRNEPCVCF